MTKRISGRSRELIHMNGLDVAPVRYNGVVIELDPLDQICATFRAATSGGVEGMDAEGLERAAVLARRLRELSDRLEVHALGALDESQASIQRHGTPTGELVRARSRASRPSAANAQVKTARVLTRHLPDTDQGWADGDLTRSHVDVMVRAANPRVRTQITAAERDLLALVEGRTFATWKGAVAEVAAAFDQDGPDPDDPAVHLGHVGAFGGVRGAEGPVRGV